MRKKNIVELTRVSCADYRRMEKLPLLLMADNVRSAQNVGAMLRTSDALLVREMIMAGISAVPPSPEISKSSLGAEESVSWRHVADGYEEALRLKQEGVRIFVLEQIHGSVPLQNLGQAYEKVCGGRAGNPPATALLVVGNEVHGVDQRIVDIADVALEIPMHGIKHSLNVSVSAGMAIWEFYRVLSVISNK